MARPFPNLIGQTFDYLTVLRKSNTDKYGRFFLLCKCRCGKETLSLPSDLRTGKRKSCGCKKHLKSKEESALNQIYSMYKSDAKKRNLDYMLTKEETFKFFKQNCYYCNVEPKFIAKTQWKIKNGFQINKAFYNGIDRKNNDLGYFKDNCVTCCHQCNFSKSDYNTKEFFNWIKRVYEWNKLK